eukprot:TRINITY_DN3145_c0_g6_i1.p1 TRINITY_DN3145_c0_g6~~TRINITY_DN3145_c0_g6_i1.p1  ORF type:complete len:547 (-),score=116.04 TRINITY_DN3145_c0_g6_i1:1801-3411(-)
MQRNVILCLIFIFFAKQYLCVDLNTKLNEIANSFETLGNTFATVLNDPFPVEDCDITYCYNPETFNKSSMVCASRYNKEVDCGCTQQSVDFNHICALSGALPELSEKGKDDICRVKKLEKAFSDYLNSTSILTHIYLGFQSSGAYVQIPTQNFATVSNDPSCTEDCCSKTGESQHIWYDSRTRPWYCGLSMSKKDIIIVVDVSSSTKYLNKIELVKQAVTTVIKTLTHLDYFNVIVFGSEAKYLIPEFTGMITSTSYYRERFIEAMNNVEPSGSTNFEVAFDKGFEALKLGIHNNNTANCAKGLIFITDGSLNRGTPDIVQHVNRLNRDENGNQLVPIFTFGLGYSADETFLHQIACENGGIFKKLVGGDNIAFEFSQYTQFFAREFKHTGAPIFTEIFEGAAIFEGKMFVSVGKPIFNPSGELSSVIMGEIWFDDLLALAGDIDALNQTLTSITSKCPAYEPLSASELEKMRPLEYRCTKPEKYSDSLLVGSSIGFGLLFICYTCYQYLAKLLSFVVLKTSSKYCADDSDETSID